MNRLPRQARVRVRAEFDQVFGDGRRTATPLLALHWYQDDAPARLGLAVSRKVDRRAVARNRLKRVLRESFRQLRPQLRGGAYVVVARPPAAACDNAAVTAAFVQALRRAGALPPAGADVTMSGVSPPPLPTPDPPGA